eukprot:1745263-Alexandrium_andersonii.AAC.1
MKLPDGSLSTDSAVWEREMELHWSCKWQTRDIAALEVLREYFCKHRGRGAAFSVEQYRGAIAALNSPNRLDSYGLCPAFLHLALRARPVEIT